MKPQTFTDYLSEQHVQLFPTLLDDSAPDHFDDWLGDLNADEFITYADLYGFKRYEAGYAQAAAIALKAIND